MKSEQQMAFKEWASVCCALADGRQSVIFRKGGIADPNGEFQLEHREFWLFPTRFHQSPGELAEGETHWFDTALQSRPDNEDIALQWYVVVEEARQITDMTRLPEFCGLHIWSAATLDQRFHYRSPGLWALLVRVYALPEPVLLPNSPHFDGCKSWVDLPTPIATENLSPVLSDAAATTAHNTIQQALETRFNA